MFQLAFLIAVLWILRDCLKSNKKENKVKDSKLEPEVRYYDDYYLDDEDRFITVKVRKRDLQTLKNSRETRD